MNTLTDHILQFGFRVTGSRYLSERISQRRLAAKWEARKCAHLAAGGHVVTIEGPCGESSHLVAAGELNRFFNREA